MKKRLISVLLTLCLVMALVPCLTITAAAADTITYTLKSGDNVYNVCKANGIDFYANMNWIMRANNISNFNKLPVGKVLTLPAPGTTPSINDLPGSTGTTGTTGITGTTGTTGGTTAGTLSGGGVASGTLLAGDYVTEYLIYHTMVSGDTVGALCNRYGIDFAANSDRIMRLNNIKSYNRIAVGKTLLLPATSLPTSGNCIQVVAHRVASGETAIGICNSYGISYTSNASLMQALNNNSNLANIRAGQTLLVPVMATITNGSVGGTTGSTGSTGSTGGNTGTTTPDTTTTYKVNKKTVNVNYGSYAISSTTAKEGDTVTIKTSPKTNYALGSVSVRNDSTGDAVEVSYSGANASFKMPASDVTVDVNFTPAKQYNLNLLDADNGDYRAYVNGVKTYKAMEGQRVVIQTVPDAKYELDEITYYNSKGAKIGTADWDDSFIMPGEDITLKATFKKMTEYKINASTSGKGDITVTLNGKTVTKALSGETIKVTAMPEDGYSLSSLKVIRKIDGAKIPVSENNTFVMPRSEVDITATFSAKAYEINTTVGEHGSYTVAVATGGTPFTAVNGGVTTTAGNENEITLTMTPEKGYQVDNVRVTKVSTNSKIKTTPDSFAPDTTKVTFNMPSDDVNVSVTFKPKAFTVKAEATSETNLFKVSTDLGSVDAKTGGGNSTTAYVNSNVVVKAWPSTLEAGYLIKSVEVTTDDTGVTIDCPVSSDGTSASFVMPAENVTVKVNYVAKGLTITTNYVLNAGATGTYTVTLTRSEKAREPVKAVNGTAVIKDANVGDKIALNMTEAKAGYSTVKVEAKTASGKAVNLEGLYKSEFTMPAESVIVTLTFDRIPLQLTFEGDVGTSGAIYDVNIAGKVTTLNEKTTGPLTAYVGDSITITGKLAQGYSLDCVSYTPEGGDKVSSGSGLPNYYTFTMPAANSTVRLTMRRDG